MRPVDLEAPLHAAASAGMGVNSIRRSASGTGSLSVAFVMEQALGHVTYARNLGQALAEIDGIEPRWLPIPYERSGWLDALPGIGGNWSLRASRRAWLALRAAGGAGAHDAIFYHTQTTALLAPLAARQAPVVISLDATPVNFDTVGAHYGHAASPGSRAEKL